MSAPTFDIGHGVTIWFVSTKGVISGIGFEHRCAGARPSQSWIPFKGRPHGCDLIGWTVETEDPLTLSPSILCPECGHHGFIRAGRWVPA